MKRILQIGILILIGLMAVGFALHRFERYHRGRIDQVKEMERRYWQQQTDQLEAQLDNLEKEIKDLKVSKKTRTKLSDVFKEDPQKLMFPEGQPTLEMAVYQLVTFFSYLDQQQYIKAHQLRGGSQQLFRQSIEQLLQNLPMFNAEMATISNLARNLDHFQSVLGKDAAGIFSEIFTNETELLEPVLQAFYVWFDLCENNPNNIIACPKLPQLYEYASFFLGTFAGRNYLFESSPKMRVLLNYYSVLIVDRALDDQTNPNGIDIREHILSTMQSINLQKDLVGLEVYQEKLKSLARKYQLI